MSQKTLNLCLERYNFIKFGETTKSSHTVLCINNAYNVNSDKYRLTPTELASKHSEGFVFTLNYDFDRPLFTIVQKSYALDGTSGNIVFEGIDPISKDGSKYLRKVTVAPVKLSDNSYLLEVTNDEYLRIGITGAALGDEGLASLNEKIVTAGGIEKSVETVGGKQVLKLDAGGSQGAKEIVYFDIDPTDPPSGLYDSIAVTLSNDKEPVIRIDDSVYFYTATVTDKYVFVGGYNTDVVNYTTVTVSDDDSVVKEVVDTIEGMIFPLYYHSEGQGFTVADKTGHALTKTEIVNAYRAGQVFMFSSYPASNTQAHWGYCCDIKIDSNNTGYAEFFILAAFGGDSYRWEKYRINLSSGTEFVTLWGPNTSYSTGYSGYYANGETTVSVSTTQTFNSTQKAKGRENIGAASASDVAALKSFMIAPCSDWLTFDGSNNLVFGSVFSSTPEEVVGDKIRMIIRDGETKYCIEGAKLGVYKFEVTINVKWTGTPVNKIGNIYGYEIDFSKNFNFKKIGIIPSLEQITSSAQDFYKLSAYIPASKIDAPIGVQISISLQIQYLGNVEG